MSLLGNLGFETSPLSINGTFTVFVGFSVSKADLKLEALESGCPGSIHVPP